MLRLEFHDFLACSLDVLAAESPDAYAGLIRALEGLPLRLEVDGRARVLVVEDGRHALRDEGPAPVLLRTSRRAILALVDADATLIESVLDERFHLRGSPSSLVRLDEALRMYLAGAIRAPGLAALLADYRRRG